MTMKLKDALEDAVSDTTVDVPALVWSARRDGLATRRRRRVLAGVGIAGVLALVGGVSWVALSGDDDGSAHDPQFVAAPVDTPDELSGLTGPVTGRGAVAALVASVSDATEGDDSRFAHFRGNAGDGAGVGPEGEPMAEFLYTSDDAAPGLVLIDLQPLDGPIGDYLGPPPYTCDQPFMKECTVVDLPGGDALRTYVDRASGSDPGFERNVAELISQSRGMRLVLGASTTTISEEHVVRSDPPLTIDQLSQVAEQPWWSMTTLPVEYLQQGADLPSYEPMCADQHDGADTVTMCG